MDPTDLVKPSRLDWDALDRYLADEANLSERARASAYFDRCSGAEAQLGEVTTYLTQYETRVPSWESMRRRVTAAEQSGRAGGENTHNSPSQAVRDSRYPSRRSSHFRLRTVLSYPWRAVATLTLGVAAICLGLGMYGPSRDIQPPTVQTYTTRDAQRARITLPGGSHAILGPATTLRMTQGTDGISATVDGEALFTVRHSAAIPFIVRTKQSITRVLGTTFMVRQYANERVARVVVADGRVSVHGVQNPISTGTHGVLTANALATVTDSGQVTVTPGIVPRNYSGWTTGELLFQGALARDVVEDLNRAYGVRIQLSDSTLSNQRIDWIVQSKRFPLSKVLPELLMMLNAHVKDTGNIIRIAPGQLSVPRSDSLR